MNDFIYNWKTKILFGSDHFDNIKDYFLENDFQNILILHDSGEYLENEELLPKLRITLKNNDISYYEKGHINPNPTLHRIQEIIDELKNIEIDFILAVGGGSVIDSAKIVALKLENNEKNIIDIFDNIDEFNKSKPVGVILTIASSGSETSNAAIINVDQNRKRAINSDLIIPEFAVLNPRYTFSLPDFHTAAGGCDIIFHTMERYFSPTENTLLTDSMSEGLMRTVMSSLVKVLRNQNDYSSRANLMWAGTVSHNGILGVGKEEDWGVHMIAHELSGFYGVVHGASICSIWGSWARHVYDTNVERFYKFATNVMGCYSDPFDKKSVIEEGITRFENFMKSVGMPTKLKELNLSLSNEELETLAKSTLEGKKFVGNMRKLYYQDIVQILRNSND